MTDTTDPELPDVAALRSLEPPPGGVERLRARIQAEDRSSRRRWLAWPLIACAAALIVLVTTHGPAPGTFAPVSAPVADREIGQGSTFYWVASAPSTTHTTSPPPVIDVATISLTP